MTYDDQRISIVFLNEATPNAEYLRKLLVNSMLQVSALIIQFCALRAWHGQSGHAQPGGGPAPVRPRYAKVSPTLAQRCGNGAVVELSPRTSGVRGGSDEPGNTEGCIQARAWSQ